MRHINIIIPAAGAGTRFHELGKAYPKCLLPYEGKPILWHNMQRIHEQLGNTQLKVVVVVLADDWVEHSEMFQFCASCMPDQVVFKKIIGSSGPAATFHYGMQELTLTDNSSVLLMLSDSIFKLNLVDFITGVSELACTSVQDPQRWCMARKVGDVLELKDKPTSLPDDDMCWSALTGLYYFQQGAKIAQYVSAYVTDMAYGQQEPQFSWPIRNYSDSVDTCLYQHGESAVLDVGTLESYKASKHSNVIKPRSFNNIEVQSSFVTKSSEQQPNKILQEASWLQNIPMCLSNYTPRIIDVDVERATYTMERIYSNNLRNLALYYDTSRQTWEGIFNSVYEWFEATRYAQKASPEFWEKFFERVTSRCHAVDANSLVEQLFKYCSPFLQEATLYHGDMHFANMFYDYVSGQVKFVDPRGELYGHWLYDIAKLLHSLYGCYDHVEEDLFYWTEDAGTVTKQLYCYDKTLKVPRQAFQDIIWAKLTRAEQQAAKAICSILFATMIPLHGDNSNHQQAFQHIHNKLQNIHSWPI